MITKIVILLVVVGIIFGWDKVINLFKAIFQAKEEFKKGLEEEEEVAEKKEERKEGKPIIKVIK
ncbi:twin-arginine translocase TatA/TatE family subunit [Phorcysia thermohydrogeniphila]|uniref:Sec-independent protein translocase protein TatA n=1 Tax=Phorcysia thermohydrogeniphila TaxID=936138 RepID=A0A4R1G9V1_9BACT|nr:twin-arginine translocase TatA/TatE family subunit [Phorcysia thermohydrogeniphila]TCK03441.1 sec-independent protein translocase protein TatA [Phorcysia thermohydrogeniphila]